MLVLAPDGTCLFQGSYQQLSETVQIFLETNADSNIVSPSDFGSEMHGKETLKLTGRPVKYRFPPGTPYNKAYYGVVFKLREKKHAQEFLEELTILSLSGK